MTKILNNLPAVFTLGLVITLSLFLSNNEEEMRIAQLVSPLFAFGALISIYLRHTLNKASTERDFESHMLDEAWERIQEKRSA